MRPRFSHDRRGGVTGTRPIAPPLDCALAVLPRPDLSPGVNVIRMLEKRHRPGETSPLRPAGAAAHHTDMTLRRTIIALRLAMVMALVAVARVPASGGPGRPKRSDVSTLFFTLGRVGTTAGGWLITAVTTSP
jgi:hypothetical protein